MRGAVNPGRESSTTQPASESAEGAISPDNLSGHRTGRARQRWKAVGFARLADGESPTRTKLSGTHDSGGTDQFTPASSVMRRFPMSSTVPTPELRELLDADRFTHRHIGLDDR